MREMIQQAIQQALDEAPERKFVEAIEIAFTIKDVDLKNPANRIQEEIRLLTVVERISRLLCLLLVKWLRKQRTQASM